MKAMSKSELAAKAGVSRTTLKNWCKPYQKELEAMGLGPNAKVLPPNVVQFIVNTFCINIER
jgi:transposase